MAQGKKRRAVRRGKAIKRKTRSRTPAARGKVSKPSLAKAVPKKSAAKTKRIATRLATRRQRPGHTIKAIKVDQVKQPAAGVAVISEYESVQTGTTPVTAVPDETK